MFRVPTPSAGASEPHPLYNRCKQMKTSISSIAAVFLAASPFVHGGSMPDRTQGPCVHVSIQNDRVNESNVRQNCDRNVNRTVQAGADNWAQTTQTGSVNNNKVRQYHYDLSEYFGRNRGR